MAKDRNTRKDKKPKKKTIKERKREKREKREAGNRCSGRRKKNPDCSPFGCKRTVNGERLSQLAVIAISLRLVRIASN